MSNAIFPNLIGLGWPVARKPYFSTIVSTAAAGQETRIPNFPVPLERFELPVNHLHGTSWGPGNANGADFPILRGFFVARLGPLDSFLFWDPADNYTVTNAQYAGLSPASGQNVIGTGDGTTTAFQLMRSIGGVAEPVYNINGITASGSGPQAPPIASPYVNVFVGGAPVLSGWTVNSSGVLTFASAPANGAGIAADFSYFKRVRFSEDYIDLENFMANLYRTKKILLKQVYG